MHVKLCSRLFCNSLSHCYVGHGAVTGNYLEIKGLRIVLKKVKGQLVRQQDVILHGTSWAAQEQTTSVTKRSIIASCAQRVQTF